MSKLQGRRKQRTGGLTLLDL